MGERVICYQYTAGKWPAYEPDPDAPSVAEVVEVLRQARKGFHGKQPEMDNRIDSLIARLEGEG